MSIKKHYCLEDFIEYAERACPDEFAVLNDCPDWVFEPKVVRDRFGSLFRAPMLLVGRPFYHQGIQTAWAYTRGSGVEYYYGHRHEDFLHPIRDLHCNKIYFDEPLTHIAGSQDARGMTKSRWMGKALAETVISVKFLLKGDIHFISNLQDVDMPDDFRFACLNFEASRDSEQNKTCIILEAYHTNEKEQAAARKYGHRTDLPGGSSVRVKHEFELYDHFGSSIFSKKSNGTSSLCSADLRDKLASMANDVRTFRAHTEAQLEQEKTARIAREDRLGQQERKLEDTREELGIERHQRQNAENQLRKERIHTRESEKELGVKTWQCGVKRSASPLEVYRSVKRGKMA